MKVIETRIELAEKAFRKLGKEYAGRKAIAQKLVVDWGYSKRSVFDIRPLQDEVSGWPPGRRLKSKPADLKNIFETGYDAAGRVVMERQYTESVKLFYETFYDWSVDPIQIAHYDYDTEKQPIFSMFAEVIEGRVVATWVAAKMGLSYDVYHWQADRCIRIDSYYSARTSGKRRPLSLFSIVKATYDKGGVLLRVANHSNESDDDPEITFELRGEKEYWRKR